MRASEFKKGVVEMKQTVNLYDFREAFKRMGRNDSFTYEGLEVMFDFLEELDENLELDPIMFCGWFAEYENLAELQENYDGIETMEAIEERTTVLPIGKTGRFLIEQF
jgi:hypothetical protein